eukprot:CAMPEP_0204344052 /NCGR_PEP_ID=MMETSP0469-20131031/25338_1 /ASSEMBLY_ACC=CAM_ASM_000384 /TAXON_ID=2969 /ORGANISM="Oxyrrhis marina" /LENGTH=422 /DNA_ID=CAMNT_0051329259 /DNA_START=1 /DNA_END=1269 /DNA_ORIENTATION=+
MPPKGKQPPGPTPEELEAQRLAEEEAARKAAEEAAAKDAAERDGRVAKRNEILAEVSQYVSHPGRLMPHATKATAAWIADDGVITGQDPRGVCLMRQCLVGEDESMWLPVRPGMERNMRHTFGTASAKPGLFVAPEADGQVAGSMSSVVVKQLPEGSNLFVGIVQDCLELSGECSKKHICTTVHRGWPHLTVWDASESFSCEDLRSRTCVGFALRGTEDGVMASSICKAPPAKPTEVCKIPFALPFRVDVLVHGDRSRRRGSGELKGQCKVTMVVTGADGDAEDVVPHTQVIEKLTLVDKKFLHVCGLNEGTVLMQSEQLDAVVLEGQPSAHVTAEHEGVPLTKAMQWDEIHTNANAPTFSPGQTLKFRHYIVNGRVQTRYFRTTINSPLKTVHKTLDAAGCTEKEQQTMTMKQTLRSTIRA